MAFLYDSAKDKAIDDMLIGIDLAEIKETTRWVHLDEYEASNPCSEVVMPTAKLVHGRHKITRFTRDILTQGE